MTREKRPYRKRRRAEHEALTRLRITEAAVKLHGSVGPAHTTIKDVAAEAGVQRATVYRHFPDLESLFAACSAHWASLHPPPDPAEWESIADPEERLRRALTQLYAWYQRGERMLANVIRDAPVVPAMHGARERFQEGVSQIHAALMLSRRSRGRARARVAVAIGHAIEFSTWQSLVRAHGLQAAEARELMIALVAAAELTSSLQAQVKRRPVARDAERRRR